MRPFEEVQWRTAQRVLDSRRQVMAKKAKKKGKKKAGKKKKKARLRRSASVVAM
jgi:hypothetical protein